MERPSKLFIASKPQRRSTTRKWLSWKKMIKKMLSLTRAICNSKEMNLSRMTSRNTMSTCYSFRIRSDSSNQNQSVKWWPKFWIPKMSITQQWSVELQNKTNRFLLDLVSMMKRMRRPPSKVSRPQKRWLVARWFNLQQTTLNTWRPETQCKICLRMTTEFTLKNLITHSLTRT